MFAGQPVGITEVDDHIWLVSFLGYDLGFFDKDTGRVELADNPLAPEKVLTMYPVYTLRLYGGERGIRTLDTRLTYTPLAGERLQPLGHLSKFGS